MPLRHHTLFCTNAYKAVWKGTRRWTQHALDKTSERILNAQPIDDDDDDEDGEAPETAGSATSTQSATDDEPNKSDGFSDHPDIRQRV